MWWKDVDRRDWVKPLPEGVVVIQGFFGEARKIPDYFAKVPFFLVRLNLEEWERISLRKAPYLPERKN